jgi:hypothetical protein
MRTAFETSRDWLRRVLGPFRIALKEARMLGQEQGGGVERAV